MPWIKSIPKLEKLQDTDAKDGLVLGDVRHTKGAEDMSLVVMGRGINYPVCDDRSGITTSACKVNSLPDHYLIDRQGKLRIADCKSGSHEETIKILQAE